MDDYMRPTLCTEMVTIYEDAPRSSDVLNKMHCFYQDENLCDLVLLVESERLPCHRLVLAASSSYFEGMLHSDYTHDKKTS